MNDLCVPVILRPDYTFYFERYAGRTWIHNDVYKWNPSVRRSLLSDLDTLVALHNQPIYAIHEIDNKTQEKFFILCKFQYLENVIGADGKERQIYFRSK